MPDPAHSQPMRTGPALQAFGLKLNSRTSVKRILVSAGPIADKARLFPLIARLHAHKVEIFASTGTADYFRQQGLEVHKLRKIAEGGEPNILTLLQDGQCDCVINILVGDNDYDAASDSKIIRSLAIALEIPLFTDPDLAEAQLTHLLDKIDAGKTPERSWDLRAHFLDLVHQRGGFANHHGHFDKSFLISPENLSLGQADMQKKWYLYRYLKENYTRDDLYARMSRCVEMLLAQGCRYTRTMVDADSIVKMLALETALELKKDYASKIHIDIGIQPLEGVVDPQARKFYEAACEKADFLGGLPSRDRPQPEKHLDIIFSMARAMNKPIDVHVDQENNPDESETELLALKTIEYGLQGKVFAVHAISLAAKHPIEQDRIIAILKDAGVGVICCPSAALSMKSLDRSAPLHNSIAPVPRLLAAGVPVYLGIDNIADLFMPLVDADLWTECRLLMEACRLYELETVADLTTRKLPTTILPPTFVPDHLVRSYQPSSH